MGSETFDAMGVMPLAGLLGLGSGSPGRALPPGGAGPAESPVAFLALEEFASRANEAEANGMLPVFVQPLRPADRGKLGLVIEEAVESALERRGACPPGVGAATDLESSLGDQLYRARLIEARGLSLFVGELEGAATLGGALDAEDSAVLRFWLDAPRSLPVRLWLAPANRSLLAYGPPLPLGTWVDAFEPAHAAASPHVAPEVAASAETMELSEPPPAVAAVAAQGPAEAAPVVTEAPAEAAPVVAEAEAAPVVAEAPAEAAPVVAEGPAETAPVVAEGPAETATPPEAHEFRGEEPKTEVKPLGEAQAADEAPVSAPAHTGPLHPGAGSEWQAWARDLETTRGPKPLAAVERMFVMSYVPLRDAVLRGVAPSHVMSTLEGWATSFASSYREAFEALKARGKRPTMVLDVPEVALRIGRLHGARSVQLLMVDGLRFDLGLRVELGLRARLGREVALTERLLLWSALPSRTEVQLELLGRGPEGLKELGAAPESDVPVARGRMARTPRRIKAGHRELLKLDLVEARLTDVGPAEASRLDSLGAEVTDAVAELCEKLPPRTLLFVFGDHGFCLDPHGDGTGPLRQGGSRPEEVLVPAFAWLVGGLQ